MGRLTHRTSPGATYFVTTKAWQSSSVFQVREVADIVVTKLLEYRNRGNYLLHEFVLMPNHLHLILTPTHSTGLEKAMQLIKGGSSHEIHRVRGNKMKIWQSGFHESRVTDWTDYEKKANYVRFNPVGAKLVDRPQDWPFGSASDKYRLDPTPPGLKPPISEPLNVGAKAPTPKEQVAHIGDAEAPTPTGAKAHITSPATAELKLRPPKEHHA